MMYVRGFKGCLQCGCELRSGFGSWMCGHNQGRRTLRQMLAQALEIRPDAIPPAYQLPAAALPLREAQAELPSS